ncbi:DUF72 domain-containing protein [Alkalicoccus urumqiensis]|uniref:DUF72 domain-containing protein n=1 Tax=Alkalicoccus urumqiensis TaxID=1548213 RepID=A0A2P6MGY7_ALKUR|nr:DUF72 domain-containing protein [Alkalicoccus urumqiensis]PRO65542.1 DUF72 domain-containing protein [Alkalicoccus urumqiensis]
MGDSRIIVGLTGWRDHVTLYEDLASSDSRLAAYSAHFPVVELDSSFYAVPPAKNIQKWISETPESFQFVVKAYQGMTGHQRGESPFSSHGEMLDAFRQAFTPMKEAGKVAHVLCQFPPWFDCQRKNVDYLKWLREELRMFDCALEFRHQSWYAPEFKAKTLQYMKEDNWIHTVCDEPQIGERSVPFVAEATNEKQTLIRLHGRNEQAWQTPARGESWRKIRYLYDYSEDELKETARAAEKLAESSEQVYVMFNNNSGGHAADNALRLISMMGLSYEGLSPKQMNLFQDD